MRNTRNIKQIKMHQPRINLMLTATVIFTYIVLQSYAEYDFNVTRVEKCPMSEKDWDMASDRLKCNETHGYHCVPNKQFTSLIEFCYPKGYKFPFEKGNCLKLAANGILNQVPCAETFYDGCPEKHYHSNEIFNYPKCLMVNKKFGCFEADHECINSGVLKYKQNEGKITTTENVAKDNVDNESSIIKTKDNSIAVIAILACLLVIVPAILITLFVYVMKRRNQHRYEQNQQPREANCKQSKTSTLQIQSNEEESKILLEEGSEQFDTLAHQRQANDDNVSLLRETGDNQHESNVNQLRKSIVDGDIRTFLCSIQNFEKTSLEEVDSRGFNCLHLAAKGGNLSIFNRILHLGVSIEKKTNDEQNVLHIAAHHGCLPICNHVLNNHKGLFSQKDNSGMNPAHYAALAGQYHILDLMLKQNCNLSDNTKKYDESIVHLACMGGSLEVCKFVNSNTTIASILHAKNCEGWNSIQYATKNGHFEIVQFLYDNKVDVKNKSTKTGMNCLHTACKIGHYLICEYLLNKKPALMAEVDFSGQHAGYHAVKNGHIDILKLLIKTNKSELRKTMPDKINILHIACKHAMYNECVLIAEEFPSMVQEITERGWNAALFLAEKSDKEDERIQILKYLVNQELDVCNESRSGKTILDNAKFNNLNNIEQYLTKTFPKLKSIKRPVTVKPV